MRGTMTGGIRRTGFIAAIAALGLVAAALTLSDRPQRVVVLFPPEGLAEALPAGAIAVVTAPLELTVEGGAGLAEALRAAGARIVLPEGRVGCAPGTLP
jgi:hypothetical protein